MVSPKILHVLFVGHKKEENVLSVKEQENAIHVKEKELYDKKRPL